MSLDPATITSSSMWRLAATAPKGVPLRVRARNVTGTYLLPFRAVYRKKKWYHAEKGHELVEVEVIEWQR